MLEVLGLEKETINAPMKEEFSANDATRDVLYRAISNCKTSD